MAASLMDQAKTLTDANTITPTTQAYDETSGVEGRANRIASSGSPLMQAAETRGLQAAAKRGLTDSSIGIESAQKAVLDSAVPIAATDASLSSQQSLANQAAKNNAATVNAQLGVGAGSTAMGYESAERQQGAALAQNAQQFGVTSGQAQQQIDAQRQQFAQSLGLNVQDLALRRDTLSASQQQFLQNLDLQEKQLGQQQSQFGQTLAANQGNFAAELGQKATQFNAAQAQQVVLANLDASTRVKMTELDAASRQDIQGSVNISNAWSQMMQNVQAIQNNANLDASTKSTLINNNMESFKAFSAFWKKTNNVDIGDLLNFGIAPAPATGPGFGKLPGGPADPNAPPPQLVFDPNNKP